MNTIVVAMPSEAEALVGRLKLFEKDGFYENDKFRLFVTGIGVSNVIKTVGRAIRNGNICDNDIIINVGYAGAKGLDIGSIVCISECRRFRPSVTIQEEIETLKPIQGMKSVKCFSNEDFVESDTENNDVAYDMELYYLCRFFDKQISSIKILSDNLDYHAYEGFKADSCWDKVAKILQNF